MIMLQIYVMYAPKTSASDNFYKIGFRMRCQRRKILLITHNFYSFCKAFENLFFLFSIFSYKFAA